MDAEALWYGILELHVQGNSETRKPASKDEELRPPAKWKKLPNQQPTKALSPLFIIIFLSE